jgi:hypothetical protein
MKSLLTTEDSTKHKEADIEWLEAELEQANEIIDLAFEWIDECKNTIKS